MTLPKWVSITHYAEALDAYVIDIKKYQIEELLTWADDNYMGSVNSLP